MGDLGGAARAPPVPSLRSAEVGHTGGVLSLTPARPEPSSGRSLELPSCPALGHCFLKSAVQNSNDAFVAQDLQATKLCA